MSANRILGLHLQRNPYNPSFPLEPVGGIVYRFLVAPFQHQPLNMQLNPHKVGFGRH